MKETKKQSSPAVKTKKTRRKKCDRPEGSFDIPGGGFAVPIGKGRFRISFYDATNKRHRIRVDSREEAVAELEKAKSENSTLRRNLKHAYVNAQNPETALRIALGADVFAMIKRLWEEDVDRQKTREKYKKGGRQPIGGKNTVEYLSRMIKRKHYQYFQNQKSNDKKWLKAHENDEYYPYN